MIQRTSPAAPCQLCVYNGQLPNFRVSSVTVIACTSGTAVLRPGYEVCFVVLNCFLISNFPWWLALEKWRSVDAVFLRRAILVFGHHGCCFGN
jgi:hypothetical protein